MEAPKLTPQPTRSSSAETSSATPALVAHVGDGRGELASAIPLEKLLVQSVRAGLYILVLTLALVHHLYQDEFFSWEVYRNFYAVAALGLLAPVVSLPFLNGFFRQRGLVAASFALDIVLITALLLTSRLNQSIFLFLYMMTIILSGLVFQLRGALLTALACSLASSVVLLFGEELKSLGFFFLLMLNNIAFFSVAWISGFLSEQLEIQGLNISDLRRLNQNIVDTIPSGLLTVLESGFVVQANPGAVGILGDKLRGMEEGQKSVRDLFPEGTFTEWPLANRREVRINKDSETQILTLKMLPQRVGEQSAYLLVIEDETQVKKLEFAVRQSEKLAAVGQLATGIAHEIRNPLAGISGSIELLSQQQQTDDDKKLTRIILREIDRLNHLISEFLDFAKPEKPPVDAVDLGKLLDETLSQVRLNPQLRTDIEYVRLNEGEPVVRAHRDKLKQAFLNMMINACQAMGQSEKPRLEVVSKVKDDKVVIEVKDNGCGMTEEVMRRMFEPFMTTKPKGTGLGLAITHKIFETHQARIFVESKVGEGTRISVEFPRFTV
ncbi:MAG: PAS domain-containing sensor histidine kinase [Bdellovibrionaceae bacterium]|nr:PAS domain-containing sensor histidine kinase [Pseudobdellovibrionaceae bacterium]